MDLNKHIVKIDNNKPVHSHGYAEVANGERVGSTSNTSFEQRQLIDLNRQLVENYGRSAIGGSHSVVRAKKVTDIETINRTSRSQIASQRPQNNINTGPKRFVEPPSRNFNPYS